MKQMNAKQFLFRLGIKNHSSEQNSSQSSNFFPETDELKYDPMAACYMDALFPNEAAAVAALGTNYKRLECSMKRLSKSPVFTGKTLNVISELGGGTGILGMWLVQIGLSQSCRIYDYAANPITIGRSWASKLSLDSVSFHQTSYRELSDSSGDKLSEFVFCEHGVELLRYPGKWDAEDQETIQCHSFFRSRYAELAGAISSLLKPDGVALIGAGVASPWALEMLCEALREHHLIVDWELTSNRDGLQLYLRKSGEPLLQSAHEDALAIINEMKEQRVLEPHEIPSHQELFTDGRLYLEIRFRVGEESGEILLRQKAGLALYTERGSSGHESVILCSAGKITNLVQKALTVVSKTSNCIVTHRSIDPRVEERNG